MQFRQYEKQASRVNCSGHMKQDNGLNGVIFTYCILPADESERLVFGKKLRFSWHSRLQKIQESLIAILHNQWNQSETGATLILKYFVLEVHWGKISKVRIFLSCIFVCYKRMFLRTGNLKPSKISLVHKHFYNHCLFLFFLLIFLFLLFLLVSHCRFLKYFMQKRPELGRPVILTGLLW